MSHRCVRMWCLLAVVWQVAVTCPDLTCARTSLHDMPLLIYAVPLGVMYGYTTVPVC